MNTLAKFVWRDERPVRQRHSPVIDTVTTLKLRGYSPTGRTGSLKTTRERLTLRGEAAWEISPLQTLTFNASDRRELCSLRFDSMP